MYGKNFLRPLSRSEVSSAARTSSSNSGNLTLPLADFYEWILDVSAITTAGQLDVAIQVTPDNGTTYYNTATFEPVAGTAAVQHMRIRPASASVDGSAVWSGSGTGGPTVQTCVLTRRYRIAWTLTGASASYTFAVWLMCYPKGS